MRITAEERLQKEGGKGVLMVVSMLVSQCFIGKNIHMNKCSADR